MTAKKGRPQGRIFVISAPSGCGKTTLCKKLLHDKLNLSHSISVTTRVPRKGERNGADYFFVSPQEFISMIDNGELLEYEENFGQLYGTPKKGVDKIIEKGKHVLLSIDVKGAMNVRKLYPRQSVLIFIMPPSLGALKKRLEERESETAAAVTNRLKIAKKEIGYKNKFDYVVINDELDAAYRRLKDIIIEKGEEDAG